MLLELSAINNTNNNSSENNSDDNDRHNYTDIAVSEEQISGCISNSGIPKLAGCVTATHCQCYCCIISKPSSSVSNKRTSYNYMHCVNMSNTKNNNNYNNNNNIKSNDDDNEDNFIIKSSSTNNNNNNYNSNSIDYVISSISNKYSNSSSCSTTHGIAIYSRLHSAITNMKSNGLNGLIKLAIILIFQAMCADSSESTLTNVNLFIEPPAVRRSQSVLLRCEYTLEGAPLYSVKFYRGQLEFYRYTPGEFPNTKVFHYPGIKVNESVSNATQVVIRNVNFTLSGNFSCEVTADAPLFSTATAYAQMQVVEFPDKRPQLLTEHTRYEPGDVLRANCSTPPSRPKAELRFTINNIPVSSEETQYIRTVDNLIASRLSLKVQLQAIHFAAAGVSVGVAGSSGGNSNSHMINALSPGSETLHSTAMTATTVYSSSVSGASGGALLLRCTAQIGDLYQEYKEIELGTPQRDPVPARVTSSGGGFQNLLDAYFGYRSEAPSILKQRQSYTNYLIINCILLALVSSICVFRR